MRRTPSARTASIGVTTTRLAVESKLNWLFREQPTEDYGIDAHVEVVEGDLVRGKLLALQIKSGMSWFSERGPGGWWYRPKKEHIEYWTQHSLPVAIVLYHPTTRRCYWQLVNRRTLVATERGAQKLLVPEEQTLDEDSRVPLREAAEGDPYVLRIRELQLARPWMEMLSAGSRLVIDIEEWINKTSGRGSITLGIDNENGEEPTPLATWSVLLGLSSYAAVIPSLFAWANVTLHEETYDAVDTDEYEAECVIIDDEGDRFVTHSYQEWAAIRGHAELHPYDNYADEVDYWRLELTLNALGRAFLLVDEFATTGERQLTP
ncbi:MAG: DUF4365 domain-containing protein [Actinobacteria bacterium]|nr:DUF4365 domain-containing protein [Actinomycetota bacterium]